jgi:hypothetical protein
MSVIATPWHQIRTEGACNDTQEGKHRIFQKGKPYPSTISTRPSLGATRTVDILHYKPAEEHTDNIPRENWLIFKETGDFRRLSGHRWYARGMFQPTTA